MALLQASEPPEADADDEQRFRTVFERAAVGIGRVDFASARWLEVNDALCALVGYGRAEMLATPWIRMTHPDDVDLDLVPFRRMAAGEIESYSVDKRFVHKRGHPVWARLNLSLVRAADGQPQYEIAVVEDISDRKAAESELAEREAEFRAMADNIPQLAWMADSGGSIYWYNRRWYDFTGTTLEECRGWGWRRVHHPDHIERVVARLKRAWESGEPWEDTFPMRRRDGTYRWFLSRAMPIRDASGHVARWFGTNTDVTEQREAERALAEADRRKDEFLAVLAHELRNPMAPISNALAIIERSADPALLDAARATMKRQLRHLVRLVDDLLEVSRITTGKLRLNVDRIELQRVLQQAIETAGPKIDAGGHRLVVEPARREVWLMGDRIRLAQVFTNLLDNAAKYTDPGGEITLRVDLATSGRAKVSVCDTGVGIEAGALPRVFDLFTQIEQGTDKAQGGLGIGLSLAQRLVELHGGHIQVSSAGPGCGATFTVDLPVAQGPTHLHSDRGEAAGERGVVCTVLVADDNRDAADTLAMMLSIAGHEVAVVYGGREAIQRALAQPPQLAILDIGMPECDGYAVARSLRAELAERCPVLVALTGWGQEADKRRATAAGFDYHFTKPVDPARIEAVIERVCERGKSAT